MSQPPTPSARRRTIASWALWDWGSASFNAVIVTFVFAPYLTNGVATDETTGSSQLGVALGVAGVLIAVLAPAAGIRADAGARHRFWLGFHTAIVVLSMFGLFFVEDSPEFMLLGLILMAVGSVFFELAEVSYNGILVRISTRETVGRISGLGWGLGYIGGLVLLVLLLVTLVQPEVGLFGATDEGGMRYRLVAVVSALWFAVFAVPVLVYAPKPHEDEVRALKQETPNRLLAFLSAYRQLGARLRDMWRHDRRTLHFFIASAVFRDGLAAIFAFAGVLAAGSYGFDGTQTILLGVAANIVAGVGAIAAGFLDDKVGAKRVMVVGLACLVLAGLPIAFSDSVTVFWVCALTMCLFVGPVQSSSRTFLARITPPGREGENFGLYATTGRAVSFLGPFAFATAISLFGYQRAGALGIVLVLLVGLAILIPLKETRRPRVAA